MLQDEETGRVLLTDFGLAALLESSASSSPRLNAAGPFVGDVRFVSPEQLRGERPTERADGYQLGVLAHYLLTGEGPFGSVPPDRLPAAHLHGEPADLARVRPEVGLPLADLVRRCLAKDPRSRPTAADIAHSLSGHGVSESPDQAPLDLLARRIPQFVVGSVLLGLGVMQLVSELIQNQMLGNVFYPLAIVFAIHLVLVTSVISWFHGAKGCQEVQAVEVAMLMALAATWLAVSAWVTVF